MEWKCFIARSISGRSCAGPIPIIRPVRVVLVEAEVWPNLAAEARGRGLPLALVNARLSQRSEQRFRRFLGLVAPTFRCLDLVCVQEPEDVERWVALGVPRRRIHHVGSIKYDPTGITINPELPLQVLRAFGLDGDRPILFGGSTHAGEEEILGRIFQRFRDGLSGPHFDYRAPPRRTHCGDSQPGCNACGLEVSLRSEAEVARPGPA